MVNAKFNKKYLILLAPLLVLSLFLFGCTQNSSSFCGDGICSANETSTSCPSDCATTDSNGGGTVLANTTNAVTQGVNIPNCVASVAADNYISSGYVAGKCADCQPPGTVGGNADSCVNQDSGGKATLALQSSQLMKFYCTADGWARKIVDCPNGCQNGACKQ